MCLHAAFENEGGVFFLAPGGYARYSRLCQDLLVGEESCRDDSQNGIPGNTGGRCRGSINGEQMGSMFGCCQECVEHPNVAHLHVAVGQPQVVPRSSVQFVGRGLKKPAYRRVLFCHPSAQVFVALPSPHHGTHLRVAVLPL